MSIPEILNRRHGEGHAQTEGLGTKEDSMPSQKYLVFIRSADRKHEPPSRAQMQEMYEAFSAWKQKFKDDIVDMGGKLKPGGKIVRASGMTDGPFTESKEVVGGDMIVTAENYDRAIEIVRTCPGVVSVGTSAEIREIVNQ
jgi:hypothetical protein